MNLIALIAVYILIRLSIYKNMTDLKSIHNIQYQSAIS